MTTISIPPARSSQIGMLCCPGDIAYGVGKAAAVYMTRQLAVDLAGKLVACNAVAPGKIVTGHDTDVREYRYVFGLGVHDRSLVSIVYKGRTISARCSNFT